MCFCLTCLVRGKDQLVCVSMNHFYIVNLVTGGGRAKGNEISRVNKTQ